MNLYLSDDSIWFNDEKHIYTNKDNERYTSVTKFIESFKPKFDSSFWLRYKAVERLLISVKEHETWKKLKLKYLQTEDKNLFLNIETLHQEVGSLWQLLEKLKLEKLQLIIKKEWDEKSKTSLAKGSSFHDQQEDFYRKKYSYPSDFSGYDLRYPNLTADYKVEYPELRLYNHEYKLAGSADLITTYKNGNIDICDYKTSKTLDFQSYQNPYTKHKQMMKDPISDLDDCNFTHYSLQLSIYAWMMEQLGYKISNLTIEHIIYTNMTKKPLRKVHTVTYMKKAVELMLNYHQNESKK